VDLRPQRLARPDSALLVEEPGAGIDRQFVLRVWYNAAVCLRGL
jgi:hypothetical protein